MQFTYSTLYLAGACLTYFLVFMGKPRDRGVRGISFFQERNGAVGAGVLWSGKRFISVYQYYILLWLLNSEQEYL